jgi:hypothetical protein
MTMLRYAFLAILGLALTPASLMAQTGPAPSPPATSPPAAPPATAEAPDSAAEPMEEPQTGDHWTYEVRDDITGEVKSTITNTVTDVSGTDINVRLMVLGNANPGYLNFDRSWNLTNSGIWRYTPNDGSGIRAPLTAGKSWSFKGTDLNSTAGVSWKRTGTSKVIGQESITTRAGTFDAFKIETSIQVQNANDPTKKLQAVQETWYAPVIDHWVKRTYVSRLDGRVRDKSTTELVEYGRR